MSSKSLKHNQGELPATEENVLSSLASMHTPEDTETRAVIDQWEHALATNSDLYCNHDVSSPDVLKKEVLTVLKTAGTYSTRKALFDDVFGDLPLKPSYETKFRFIDLFAGIGGMRLGFQNVGGTCVFSSEFDKHAQETYKANHGEFPFGDITKISNKPESIPDHDVLLAGFPCQPFSQAGLKLGIEDTRGTLFHDIAKILKTKKPSFAVLENVRGLISHDKGRTLRTILQAVTSIGYRCNISAEIIKNGTEKELQEEAKKMVLKALNFGVPQIRQRIYIVLWKDEKIKNFDYPQPTGEETRVGNILESNPCESLTISDKIWEGHQRRKLANKAKGKGFGFNLVNEDSAYTWTISARYYKDGSEALVNQLNANPRMLSPRECARLQGFPESFKFPSSKKNAYQQFGNSVTINVVESVAQNISKLLG